jgi:hypothetical protein
MNHYTDNRDHNEMEKYYLARIEALENKLRQIMAKSLRRELDYLKHRVKSIAKE